MFSQKLIFKKIFKNFLHPLDSGGGICYNANRKTEKKEKNMIRRKNEGIKYPIRETVVEKVGKGLRKNLRRMSTFRNPDGRLWEERFEDARGFSDGLALVKLEDGWTYVDVNRAVWKERFEDARDFSEGLAPVELEDGWTYVDANHKLWEERFKTAGGFGSIYSSKIESIPNGIAYSFISGIAEVTLKNGEKYLVDHDKNMCPAKFKYELDGMSADKFLGLGTDCFENEGFIKMAMSFVKRDLLKQVKRHKEIDDEYANYCVETLEECAKKIEIERAEIERLRKDKPESDKKREELIKKIENFGVTKESK